MKLKKLFHKDIIPPGQEHLVKGGSINDKKSKRGIILYWIMLVLGILFMTTIFAVGGLSLWFFVSLFLWFAYIYNILRSMSLGVFSFEKMIIFGVVVLVLSFLVVGAAPSEKPSPLDVIMQQQK